MFIQSLNKPAFRQELFNEYPSLMKKFQMRNQVSFKKTEMFKTSSEIQLNLSEHCKKSNQVMMKSFKFSNGVPSLIKKNKAGLTQKKNNNQYSQSG